MDEVTYIIAPDSNGVLDLTSKLGNDGYTALIVGLDNKGSADPTKPIATLTYSNGGYTLSNAGS